jgi:hypothetical protein
MMPLDGKSLFSEIQGKNFEHFKIFKAFAIFLRLGNSRLFVIWMVVENINQMN